MQACLCTYKRYVLSNCNTYYTMKLANTWKELSKTAVLVNNYGDHIRSVKIKCELKL